MDTTRPRAHTTEWFDDVLRSTARRAGRKRTLTREEAAHRTAAAVAKLDWYWPYWLDRQLRPAHAAFVPLGDVASIENVTARSWTTVGTIAMGALAVVDPTGFVMPASGQWGIDWIVHAGDRWYLPSREASVRQRAVDDTPVVETAIRIPDGDAIQRVFGISGEHDFGDVVVIEIENSSPVPIAISLAVRPADGTNVGVIDALEFDGNVVRINEQPALVLPRAPSGFAAGNAELEDSAVVVMNERADAAPPRRTTCVLGLANGAVVFPLAHRSTIRFYFAPRAPRRSILRAPERVPDAAAVARGWHAHLDRAMAIRIPEDSLVRGYRSAARRLLLAIDGPDFASAAPQTGFSVGDETTIATALARIGLGAHVAPLLVGRMDDQRIESWARRGDASMARNLAALSAIVAHWRATHDTVVAHAVLVPAVRMAQWCGRRIERGADALAARALAPIVQALADMARAGGQPDTGAEIDDFAAVINWHGARDEHTPSAPEVDVSADGAEVAPSRRGLDLRSTIERAARDIGGGLATGFTRVLAVTGHLSAAGSWPSFVHPRLGSGSGGLGDDPLVCARFVEAVRDLAVIEDVAGGGLRLLPLLPDGWRGQSIDVAHVPTFAGMLSYSVRWHGQNAALLWELDSTFEGEVRLCAPGLSREWSKTARSGEALIVRHEP
ncbi:MAG TPA: hypothetical protein VM282_17745 [Acidimicrobiales bacterium]|nr:hypothetical protein [Acidimicrobiales bacterium]